MLYVWIKTTVGFLLAVNFSLPLYTVVSNKELWDEPMAMLAGTMSFNFMSLGLVNMLIGAYDLMHLEVRKFCSFLQYLGFGVGMASKMGQVCMAVDRYVAVVYSLRYYDYMARGRRWLFGLTWTTCAVQLTFGIISILLELESFADRNHGRGNGTVIFPECRWESACANIFTIFLETQTATFSLITAGLFIYTGVIGHRTMVRTARDLRRLQHDNIVINNNQKFVENYRAFKHIAAVLSLTVTLDIIAPTVRAINRWYPMPKLNGMLHQLRVLGFIFEGWAYGLLNAKLRAAYKKTLCPRSNEVGSVEVQRMSEPERPRPSTVFVIEQ